MFSHLSRIIATLALLLGLAQVALGWSIASGWIGPYEAALARFSSATSSGAVIDRGIWLIAAAIAMGTLAEIGLAVRSSAKRGRD